MIIHVEPSYFGHGSKVHLEPWTSLLCPICEAPSESPSTSYLQTGYIDIGLTCLNGHVWWIQIGKKRDDRFVSLGVNINLMGVTVEVENLMRKWQYDPAKRFVNQGGYEPCTVPQQDKVLYLAGERPWALEELTEMLHGVWAYPSMAKWCKNDAGFVIAWLSGTKGDLP